MPRQLNGRTTFLALMEKIRADLKAGHFIKTVHARYERQLGMSYRQFLRYVREYGLLAEARPHLASYASRSSTALSQEGQAHQAGEPIMSEPPHPKRFIFEPAKIDEKKLI